MIFQNCNCPYCEKYRFPNLIKVTQGKLKNRLWFEIPKNGSWTLKSVRDNQIELHPTYVHDIQKHKEEKIIVIYRDPFDRFCSLYRHYFEPQGRRFPRGSKFLNTIGYKGEIDLILNNLGRLDSSHEVHHFYPQVKFFMRDFPNLEFVPIQKLGEFSGRKHFNETNEIQLPTFTDEQKEFVKSIYKEDYDFFKTRGIVL